MYSEVHRLKISSVALVFMPFALAHFLSFVFRTVNAVMYPDLAQELDLDATSLGLLTSVYFLAFAAAQLPLGVALDRFGPRKVQVPMLMIAALGALLSTVAESLPALIVARALIGFGVAGSLMAALKMGSLWLASERLPLLAGILLAIGGLGAMASTAPLQAALTVTDWRGVFLVLGIASICVSLMILRTPDQQVTRRPTGLAQMFSAVAQLYASWRFWRLALFSLFAHATFMAILGLWMGPWLSDVARFDRAAVANAMFIGTAAMIAGSLCFGWLADQLQRRDFQPTFVCGAGIFMFLLFQLAMVGANVNPYVAVIGFGFFGTATTMNYAILAQSVPSHLTGRVTTCFNLLVFIVAFALQWGIGGSINLWNPLDDGSYPVEAYRWTFGAVLALQVPGVLLWFSFKPWRRLTPAVLAPA